ncbi:MAG: hypothetical protein IJ361_09625 [Spirochaetaceae bacterium]|nr:hypothetical protein [Spirochaetaceae bacterium]
MKIKQIFLMFITIYSVLFISCDRKSNRVQRISDISVGKYHTLCLFEDGRIISFGNNESGELGIGDVFFGEKSKNPCIIETPIKFKSVATGYYHSLAVAKDGTLWGWGDNSCQQLWKTFSDKKFSKSRDESAYETPILIDNGKDWIKVFADGFDSFGLKKDGTLWRISDMFQIENPNGSKWENVNIQADFGGDDYILYLILKDKLGDIYTYGTCNEAIDSLSCFNLWKRGKDKTKLLLPLEIPFRSSDFWITDFSGAYRIKNEIHIWGMTATEENNIKAKFQSIFSNYSNYDDVFADWMFNSEKILKIKNCKKMISGNFMWSFACIGGSDFNYSYTACLQSDGTLILWTNGKTYISDKSLKIRNIWGSNGIIVQTEDCKIYVTGYNLFNRLGVDNSQEDFLFLEPLDF